MKAHTTGIKDHEQRDVQEIKAIKENSVSLKWEVKEEIQGFKEELIIH